MSVLEDQVRHAVIDVLSQLASDWDYGEPITRETYLFGDLGFESLELVILGTSLQERYGRLPFAELLAEIGQRSVQDLSVGELVDFISRHSSTLAAQEVR